MRTRVCLSLVNLADPDFQRRGWMRGGLDASPKPEGGISSDGHPSIGLLAFLHCRPHLPCPPTISYPPASHDIIPFPFSPFSIMTSQSASSHEKRPPQRSSGINGSSSSSSQSRSSIAARRGGQSPLSRLPMPSIWRKQSQDTKDEAAASSSSLAPAHKISSPRMDGNKASFRTRTRSGISSFLSPRPTAEMLDPLLTQPLSDPDAIGAFTEALREDQGKQELPIAAQSTAGAAAQAWAKLGFFPSSKSPQPNAAESPSLLSPDGNAPASKPTVTVPSAEQRKIGKISAVSDFAPIRERTSRRPARGAQDTGRREGLIYSMLRWPLLLAIFLVIGLEFAAYVLTRQIVNVVEWLVAHRGRKGVLRRQMRNAKDFQTWKDTALELDDHMEHDAWKRQDSSGLYDWILVKKVSHSLKTFREQDDVQELMLVLTLCCTNNFAGTENFRLYSETYYGSKYLIEAYLAEVELGLDYMSKTDKIPLEQKRAFFRDVAKNLGKSGLALSGGGSFGYYHIGLVKALLDANLLPRIVSGTSAGGLIAALTCTRTDEELSRLLVPELADRITACEEPITIWAKRAWQTGARFDPIEWAEKASFFTLGSLTFEEAFKRTGKVLNVSVIPSEKNSPVKLLNHITAPRCVIWSALLASAAVPGLLPPVCLMQKTRKGEYVPWNWGHRFRDGSLRVDIPLQDLHSMFQVNYPIVSQVNPHVHLFFFAPKGMPGRPVAHRKGKGWRGGFLLSASEHVLKLHLSVNFKIIRDLDLLPAILGTDWSGVFLQRFGGAVTIWPKTRFLDWVRILSDPDRPELRRMIRVGQQATWPKLHMIENRIRLERAVARGRKACRRALRAEANAASGQNTPGGRGVAATSGMPRDQAQQDHTASDYSAGPTPGIGALSETDGEGGAQGDYFRNGLPSGDGSNTGTASRRAAAAASLRRRLGGFSGIMTPASEVATPGELPRPSRERSVGMDDEVDDEEADEDEEDEADDLDFELERLRDVDESYESAVGSPTDEDKTSTLRRRDFGAEQGLDVEADGDEKGGRAEPQSAAQAKAALTAAALSPSVMRFRKGPPPSRSSPYRAYHRSERRASSHSEPPEELSNAQRPRQRPQEDNDALGKASTSTESTAQANAPNPESSTASSSRQPEAKAEDDSSTLYQALNVAPSATKAEVRSSFLRLVRVHHPDKASPASSSAPGQDDASRRARIHSIYEAYATLSDDSKREEYDEALARDARLSSAQRAKAQRRNKGVGAGPEGVRISATLDLDSFEAVEIPPPPVSATVENSNGSGYAEVGAGRDGGPDGGTVIFTHPCRCGGEYLVTSEEMLDEGKEVVQCSGCSEVVKVLWREDGDAKG